MAAATPKVTQKDVQAFSDFCVALRAIWRHNQILFGGSDLQRELMQSVAPTLFGDLNLLLIEHLILQICKITDREESGGRTNLTVTFLVNNSDFSQAPGQLEKLKQLSDSMHAFRAIILPARNKLIGHIDRDAALNGEPLGAAPIDTWHQFWLDLQDFLGILHKRYIDPETSFYLNGVAHLSDAENLVKALKESSFFRVLESDEELSRKCIEVALDSQFSEA